MPVSFAVLECESEGRKSPRAGGGRHPIKNWPGGVRYPRSLCCGGGNTDGGQPTSHHPAARDRGAGTWALARATPGSLTGEDARRAE